jgi:hemerythrin
MATEWGPDLILNHELLDRQHVETFRRLAEAAAALRADRASLEAAVAAFSDALLDHVSAEERIMEETLYPERVRHRSAHEMFVADVAKMRCELGRTGSTPDIEACILRRLPEWLRFHIRVNDAPLGEYLARKRSRQTGEARPRKPAGRHLS